MAKPRGVDAKLKRLRLLRDEKGTPEFIAELRNALGDPSNLVAAEAAEFVGVRILPELALDLVAAFDRFMTEPDKLCRAKVAIVKALNKLEHDDEDLFLRGIRHVQMEGVWGGSEDVAAELRGESAFGLVRINCGNVLNLLVDLLADREKVARLAAAQALGHSGAPAAVPLLRYKARAGDEDPNVVAECLTALMAIAPQESLPFVTEFLHSADTTLQEAAAFVLAESRRPAAMQVLKESWPTACGGPLEDVILLALSMTRLPAALDLLLDIVSAANKSAALSALSALAIHRHNEAVKDRIAAVVTKKGDAELRGRFQKKFGMSEPPA